MRDGFPPYRHAAAMNPALNARLRQSRQTPYWRVHPAEPWQPLEPFPASERAPELEPDEVPLAEPEPGMDPADAFADLEIDPVVALPMSLALSSPPLVLAATGGAPARSEPTATPDQGASSRQPSGRDWLALLLWLLLVLLDAGLAALELGRSLRASWSQLREDGAGRASDPSRAMPRAVPLLRTAAAAAHS